MNKIDTRKIYRSPDNLQTEEIPAWELGLAQYIGDRQTQEDAANASSFTNDLGQQFVVAVLGDGVGGHEDGEIASRAAVNITVSCIEREWLANPALDSPIDHSIITLSLDTAVQHAQKALGKRKSRVEPTHVGIDVLDKMPSPTIHQTAATTLDAIVLFEDEVFIHHIGNARAYHIPADGDATPLTSDHSVLGSLQRSGRDGEILEVPRRAVLAATLIHSINGDPDIDPRNIVERIRRQLLPTDRLLLCTDGLYNLLTTDQIAKIIRSAGDPQSCADQLVQLAKNVAKERGISNLDNMTAMVIQNTNTQSK